MSYKDKDREREASAERMRRNRAKGVTASEVPIPTGVEGVTEGVTVSSVKSEGVTGENVTPSSHPNMPPVVKAYLLKEYGFLPTEHMGPMTLEQYKAAHCMTCGGFYLIGTDNCPRCNVKPTAERLRALAGATKLQEIKGG